MTSLRLDDVIDTLFVLLRVDEEFIPRYMTSDHGILYQLFYGVARNMRCFVWIKCRF